MIAIINEKINPRQKKKSLCVTGVCGTCGKRQSVHSIVWHCARSHETWPTCKKCKEHVYPIKRSCKGCSAVLRNGNLGELCAVCKHKTGGGRPE